MPLILGGLDSLQQTLAAQQTALSITQRNVANANNENYTRQEVIFADAAESNSCTVTIRSLRNRYIDCSIGRESQSLGEQQVTSGALQQIDALLNENSGQGLQKALSDFFNSFNALSAAPEDLTLRQEVLAKAASLTSEFHRVSGAIEQVQISQNDEVETTIDEINGITSQIAALNDRIGAAHASGSEEEFTLRDSRQQLVEQLSGLIDVSYYDTQSGGIVVTTRQGGLLVTDNQSHVLKRNTMPNTAFSGVQLDGVDITSKLQSGKLAGLIKVRDGQIASCLSALDDMAAAIISGVNTQHGAGRDFNGALGGDFFVPFVPPVAGSNAGAAQAICVALSDGRKIAASSTTSPGDNANSKLLYGIKDQLLMSSSSETISQFYAGLIYQIGSDEKTAVDGVAIQKNILEQLKNQRASASGVNLNEEAANIIKYQSAYQANAKFASVLNSLSDVILNLVGA
jgi:flagellar hook-associated protein 1 FlgK